MDKRKSASVPSRILKSVLTFCIVFVLCVLLLPLLLLKTSDPNSLVSASIVLTLALSSVFCGVITQKNFEKNKFLTGLTTGVLISGILFLLSLFFTRESGISVPQILLLYGTPVVFSLVGTSLGAKKSKARKRKKRK